jgi:hypothetical protein
MQEEVPFGFHMTPFFVPFLNVSRKKKDRVRSPVFFRAEEEHIICSLKSALNVIS